MRYLLSVAALIVALAAVPVAPAASDLAPVGLHWTTTTTVSKLGSRVDYCPQTNRNDDGGRKLQSGRELKNSFGSVLSRFFQTIRWCYTGVPWAPYAGGKITWINVNNSGATPVVGWTYEGIIGSDGYGGAGDNVAMRQREGKFRLCGAFCVQTWTPLIVQKVWGTGQFEWGTYE